MTTELKPGTPEYDEAYRKELQRLEAEAKAKGGKDAKADETNTSADDAKPKGDAKADDAKETAEELKNRLDEERKARERLEKSLKDTQRWAHQNAARVKRLEQEAEDRKRGESLAENPVLKANPGLKEAIEHVAKPKQEDDKPAPQEQWLSSIAKAIPDVETLLADQAFFAKAKAKQAEYGPEWDDPFVAIRELSELKVAHLSEKRTTVAVEQARKDFETKAKKRSAMEMPGGSGGKDSQDQINAAEKYRTMSKEEFDKERSRVMGY